ncbi:unnamed protein product, partial [Musa acuminata subsp. burmannicoides]
MTFVSDPNEEDAELRPGVAVGVEHVERLRVLGPDHPVEEGAHVGELAIGRVGHVPRQDAGAHGHRVQQLHHAKVQFRGVPPGGVADVAPVDEGAPHGLVQHAALAGAGGGLLLALEGDADEAGGAHVLHEPGGGDGQLEEEVGDAAGVFLEGEGDAGLAVAEEGAGGAGGAADVAVAVAGALVGSGSWEVAAGRGEDGQGAEGGAEGAEEPGGFGLVVLPLRWLQQGDREPVHTGLRLRPVGVHRRLARRGRGWWWPCHGLVVDAKRPEQCPSGGGCRHNPKYICILRERER